MHTSKTFAASAAFVTALCAATTATASMATWQENAATPAVTINVGSDMTLSEALSANGVSLSGAASLAKTGNGTVTVDDASGIGSFAGEIHVFQGGWSVGTASGFGTAAGATWVYPSGCVFLTDVTVSHTGEIFHLAGTGKSDYYGWGAIRFPVDSQNGVAMAAGSYGSRWILEDDATVLVTGKGRNPAFFPSIDLELNGHELTVWRGKYGTINTGYSVDSQYCLFNSVTGAGGIVLKNGASFSTSAGFAPSYYNDGDYVCLQNAVLVFQRGKSTAGWGLVARALPASDWKTPDDAPGMKPYIFLRHNDGSAYARDCTEKSFNAWSGPVTLGCDLLIGQLNQTYAESMTFTNKISGAGGLTVANGKVWLYLDCPENDFEGGVTLSGPDNRLVLGADGALPADGGRLQITDSTVSFPASVEADWSLPALELAGTSVVQNCQGSWASVTALPGANASYESVLDADDLILRTGAKLALRPTHFSRAAYAGLEEHYDLDHSWTDIADIPIRGTQLFPHYAQNNDFRWARDSNNQQKTSTRSFAYRTFVWNNSPTNETWTFAGHFYSRLFIWLNGQLLYEKPSSLWHSPYRVTATIRPGANSLVLLADACPIAGTSDKRSGSDIGLWEGVADKGFAYAVGDIPVDDPADFVWLQDPGDGSLCTTMSGDETLDGVHWRPHFKALVMEAGSVLDLDGDAMSVETAAGSGIVTNGPLTVTQSLQVSPSVFAANGGIAVDGALTLGAGAKITFANSDDFHKRDAGLYTLATALKGIEGFTGASMLEIDGAHKCWKAGLSADGKTLSLELVPEAMVITIR